MFSRVSAENVAEMEETFELTPDEAVKVARLLLAAAEVANATTA
ncbi:hypothetical protein SAMN05421671_4970 [Pimelobacter simplex]|nr:hypothetical protein NSI01_53970 [Pimelobacter simplex]SFN07830.1 hypothetical protein SAMN05421671_4970 [Pimelobacter simplex]